MSGFAASWLALREPYDLRARNAAVLDAVAVAFSDRPSIAVVDLACGTGATLRTLQSRLPARQDWRLVDNDLSLLAQAAALGRPPDLSVSARPVDLARDLEIALDGPIDLVTTSALLDLVSPEWLDRFVVEAAARRLPVYAALSYDGRVAFDPVAPLDAEIVAALNRHQHSNKGFGPALGPDAAAQAVASFERVGYAVVEGQSDWVFGPEDRTMQEEVLAGFAFAAREAGGLAPDDIAAWLVQRRDAVTAGRLKMRVGHVDFFATPTGTR